MKLFWIFILPLVFCDEEHVTAHEYEAQGPREEAENLPKPKLKIKKIKTNQCDNPTKKDDRLEIHFIGKLVDGTVFEDTRKLGRSFVFNLGQRQVLLGWDLGMKDMCVGDQRKLTVPSRLGYGKFKLGKIPAYSTLIFEIELLSVNEVEGEFAGPNVPLPTNVDKEIKIEL